MNRKIKIIIFGLAVAIASYVGFYCYVVYASNQMFTLSANVKTTNNIPQTRKDKKKADEFFLEAEKCIKNQIDSITSFCYKKISYSINPYKTHRKIKDCIVGVSMQYLFTKSKNKFKDCDE
ncbi:MAG: hypothetical protein ACTSXL_03740 [Alphaproteobacteria bacterium]